MTKMATAMVGGIEVTVPAAIRHATMERATGGTEAEYYAAAAMYRRLFMAAFAEARRRNGEWPKA